MRQRSTSIRPLTSISTIPPPAVPVDAAFFHFLGHAAHLAAELLGLLQQGAEVGKSFEHVVRSVSFSRRWIVDPHRLSAEEARPPAAPADAASRPAAAGGREILRPEVVAGSCCPASGEARANSNSTRPPGHLGQRLFEAGDLLGPLARTLAQIISSLEANDQPVRCGKCHGIELPGVLDHHAREPREHAIPDFHGVFRRQGQRWCRW